MRRLYAAVVMLMLSGLVPLAMSEWNPEIEPHAMVMKQNGKSFPATTGPELKPPYPQDAVVTYIDKWMWDITMYMIELTVTVRDSKNFPMATGNSLHTSLTRNSPPEMVDEVVGNIVAAKH